MGLREIPSRSRRVASTTGKAFLSVKRQDKAAALEIADRLHRLGFLIEATQGTGTYLQDNGVPTTLVNKVKEGRPHIVDHIKNGEISLVVNTVGSQASHVDSAAIRREALQHNVSLLHDHPRRARGHHGHRGDSKKGIDDSFVAGTSFRVIVH